MRAHCVCVCVCVCVCLTAEPMVLGDVVTALGASVEVVKRVLHSLSCGKYKLVTKTPESKVIGEKDTFVCNAAFAAPLRKIRVPMASLDEIDVTKRVEDDRSYAIEACAVRIMKARKTLSHNELVTAVLEDLHVFRPNPKVIKKRIENLIERDYLERDTADPSIYKYLA
ncbi:hypothetical protein EON67_03245 [archaeon]|nr:MAG: hypothetical protein EON67_03245 [archaeon]